MRLITPVTAPVVSPIISADRPAVIGPVEVRMATHRRSVRFIPPRRTTARKSSTAPVVLLAVLRLELPKQLLAIFRLFRHLP